MVADLFRTRNLEDGTEITVREKTREDLDASMEFYALMPEQERKLMRIDVADRSVVESRLQELEKDNFFRLVAEVDGKFIGEAILEDLRYGWMKKTGEIRILILPAYRETDLARILSRELFLVAARRGLNNLIARILDGETWMYDTLRNLHFKHEATQKSHAVDLNDNQHDVHLMTFSLTRMWQDIENAIAESIASPREY